MTKTRKAPVSPRAACLIAGGLLVGLGSLAAAVRYMSMYPNDSLFDVRPLFGFHVKSLIEKGAYGYVRNGDYFYADRLPLIPLLLAPIAWLKNSVPLAFAIKALGSTAMLFLAVSYVPRRAPRPMALLFLLTLAIPYNLNIMYTLDHEEAYAWVLLLVAFGAVWHTVVHRSGVASLVVAGGAVALLALLKSSYLGVAIFLAVLPAVRGSGRAKFIPLFSLGSAIVLWGWLCFVNTGTFALFGDMSSMNGINLYKGNNPATYRLYPEFHPDYLMYEGLIQDKDRFDDEWEWHRHYRDRAVAYIRNNPKEFLTLMYRKTVVLFLDVREINKIPQTSPAKSTPVKLMFLGSMIVNRAVFLLSFGCALWLWFRRKRASAAAGFTAGMFLVTIAVYAFPYMVGYSSYRHFVPMVPLSMYVWLLVMSEPKRSRSLSPGESGRPTAGTPPGIPQGCGP